MTDDDFNTIDVIQHLVYPEGLAESLVVLQSKWNVAHELCFVACANGVQVGYVIAHPWVNDSSPGLEQRIDTLPPDCDVVHLHDLVVRPDFHGRGIARLLVEAVMRSARAKGLNEVTLVAVMQARTFWEKMGFEFVRNVDGYDATAAFMRLVLNSD